MEMKSDNTTTENIQIPTIGRIVHYVCEWFDTRTCQNAIRPAIVTFVDPRVNFGLQISLTIFPDELNDTVFVDGQNRSRGRSKVGYSGSNVKTLNTWHWPERSP